MAIALTSSKLLVSIFFALAFLSGCMSDIKPEKAAVIPSDSFGSGGYSGCVIAQGLDTSTIEVTYSFPASASQIEVYRDGLNILTTHNRGQTSFLDTGLLEGKTYKYECIATINDKFINGDRKVEATTLSANPPSFLGITSVTPLTPNSVRVNWPPSGGGAVVKNFKVYATMVNPVTFAEAPKITVSNGTYSTVVSGLADDMPYYFAVRACNINDLCDTNNVQLPLTMEDGGAPATVGAASASLYNGKARVFAPWAEANGAIKKRRLYRSTTNDLTTIAESIPVKSVEVSSANLNAPPTYIDDDTIAEGLTYYYLVRDEDPNGNLTASTNIVSLTIGDLTPPVFSGITSIALDTPQETSVKLQWTAINNQPIDPAGASYYLIFRTEANLPAIPGNACSSGTLVATLNSVLYTPGSIIDYRIEGLSSRKKYNFCVKAQDAALNISNTTSYREILMPDLTAPTFDGLQNMAYDQSTEKFTVIWNPSSSTDITTYQLKVWKNTATPAIGSITTIPLPASSNQASAVFGKTNFPYTDGDTVYAVVNACDDAGPTYNTVNNCTNFPISSAIVRQLLDTTPPTGFPGVTNVTAPLQGILQVTWALPADRSDYAGFKFYNIEETSAGSFTKVLLGDTYCTASNCALNPKTTFSLPINRFNHKYNIFVSAVDLAGNETKAIDAASTLVYFQVTSVDTTVPNLTSGLGSNIDGGNIVLTWNLASDNQHPIKYYNITNGIKYELYRREGATPFDPGQYIYNVPDYLGDPTITRIANNLSGTTYSDPTAPLIQGQTYHYTVCARDSSNNVKCDGIHTITLTDNVPPVINTIRIDEAANSTSWNLKIKVSDAIKPPTGITVYAYAKFSDNPADFPDGSGPLVAGAMLGTGTVSTPTEFTYYTGDRTGSGTNHYINYYVKAIDANNNVTTSTYSYALRRPTIPAATLSATVNEDTATTVTLTQAGMPAIELNASTISYELISAPTKGTLTNCMNLAGTTGGQDLSCTYLGNSNFFGTDSFTYRTKDAILPSLNVVTVTITVTNVNDNPIAQNLTRSISISDGYTSPSNSVIDLASVLSDPTIDPDNNVVAGTNTLTIVTASGSLSRSNYGTYSCSGTTCTITHTANRYNRFGTVTIPYTISDGAGGTSSSGTLTVKIYSYYTWIGKVSNVYSNKDNWCGFLDSLTGVCLGASAPPATGEDLVFSDLCQTCDTTLPSTESYSSIVQTESFTGTITIGSGKTITLTNGLHVLGGTFDGTNAGALNISTTQETETIYVENSVFKAPSTTMTLNNTATAVTTYARRLARINNSGSTTFIHNMGTVVFNNTSSAYKNFELHGISLYNLTNTAGFNILRPLDGSTSALSFQVLNNLTVQVGQMDTYFSGYVKVHGNLVGGWHATNSGLRGTLSALSTVLVGKPSRIQMGDITQNAGSITVDEQGIAQSDSVTLALTALTIKDGTFNAPSTELKINTSFTLDNSVGAPVFNHNNGLVTFLSGGSGANLTLSNPTTFYNVKNQEAQQRLYGTMIVNNTLTLEGSINANGATDEVRVFGNIQVNSVGSTLWQAAGTTIKLVGANDQSVTGIGPNSAIEKLTIAKTSGNVFFTGTLRVIGTFDLTHTTGMIDLGTSHIYLGGMDANVRIATVNPGSGQFYDLTYNPSWSNTHTFVGNIPILNRFTIQTTNANTVNGGAFHVYKDMNLIQWTSTYAAWTTPIHFVGGGAKTITNTSMNYSGSNPPPTDFVVNTTGTVTFVSNYSLPTKSMTLTSGTVNFNGKAVTLNNFTASPGTVVNSYSTLTTMGTSTTTGATVNP